MIGSVTWWEQPGRATQASVAATLLAVVSALIVIADGTVVAIHPDNGQGFLHQGVLLLCVLMPAATLAMAAHCCRCAWLSRGWLGIGAVLAAAFSVLLGLASFSLGLRFADPDVINFTNHE